VNVALINCTLENKVATITLNRVDKLNALSAQLVQELTNTLHALSQDIADGKDVRCLLLKSATPKAFCVGADLTERLKMNEDEVIETLDAIQRLTFAMENIPVPTIAVVQGAAFGGGLELALCCDLRIFHTDAVVGLTETRLAIIPGAGGTQRLTQLVGVAKAKELIFLASKIDAPTAEKAGLANAVVGDPDALAGEWSVEMSQRGPLALKAAKTAINGAQAGRVKVESLAFERQCYRKVLQSQDRLEGLAAFQAKREAVYRGE